MRMMPVALVPLARLGARKAGQALAEQFDGRAPTRVVDQLAIEPVVAAHELGGEQRRGVVVQRRRRALLLDDAVVEQQDAVGDRHRLGLVVRDVQRGQSERDDQLAQPGARFLAQLGVEVRQRLVEQDDRRVVDQRARDRDALLLAAGKLVRKARGEMAEPELRQASSRPAP